MPSPGTAAVKRLGAAMLAAGLAAVAAGCMHISVTESEARETLAPDASADFSACPAFAPAFEATDRFMTGFNARDAEAWGESLHFPHVRIASGSVRVIQSADELAGSFERLAAIGWDHSAWADRRIVQCGPTKAHMLTTFVRYRADGSELARFNSLYIVELKDGRWAITARSSFAP
ncbi:MAG: hypothetical protein R3C52_00960 [Hyphomonadaceae bacterium]